MRRLNGTQRAAVLAALVEGNSIRAIVRQFGFSKNTIIKLLIDAGAVCAEFQDRSFRNLTCRRIQCDEIWSFIGAKDKNLTEDERGKFGRGSVWTWTAIDADTKLVPTWMVGPRTAEAANDFMQDLASRLSKRIQLTTDGHKVYVDAVEDAFGSQIDYAMLIKLYGSEIPEDARYSPAQCIGTKVAEISGRPDAKHISTSYVERQNLTMRMHMRRFTRLTNAFSKKLDNHIAAISLHFMFYNFIRIHQTLRVTPAMAAGVTRIFEIADIVRMLEKKELQAKATGFENSYAPYGPA